jgi:hypothetical protein
MYGPDRLSHFYYCDPDRSSFIGKCSNSRILSTIVCLQTPIGLQFLISFVGQLSWEDRESALVTVSFIFDMNLGLPAMSSCY